LIAVPEERARALDAALALAGVLGASIGRVVEAIAPGRIEVR
jgi:hypothetical protein